jgi:hypothetical protein
MNVRLWVYFMIAQREKTYAIRTVVANVPFAMIQ